MDIFGLFAYIRQRTREAVVAGAQDGLRDIEEAPGTAAGAVLRLEPAANGKAAKQLAAKDKAGK